MDKFSIDELYIILLGYYPNYRMYKSTYHISIYLDSTQYIYIIYNGDGLVNDKIVCKPGLNVNINRHKRIRCRKYNSIETMIDAINYLIAWYKNLIK